MTDLVQLPQGGAAGRFGGICRRQKAYGLGLAFVSVLLALLCLFHPATADWLSQFDRRLTLAVVSGARLVPGLVPAAQLVEANSLFKGMVVMAAFWGLWFARDSSDARRVQLVAVLVLSIAAISIGRALATFLPFRARPRYDEMMASAFGAPGRSLETWSAMPSDHAVFFFALAVGLGQVSRLVALPLLLHAALLVCLPRVILGLHFAGDVLVGAIIGTTAAILTFPIFTGLIAGTRITRMAALWPGWFYAAAISITFLFAQMFDPVRQLASGLLAILVGPAG